MSDTHAFVHAIGTTAAASLPQRGFESTVASARYLRIALAASPSRTGVFEVSLVPREGASGTDIHLQPGQLGLAYNQRVEALVSPATRWAYRRSQLDTPTGYLVLGTLAVATTAAWIDGSLAIGNLGTKLFLFTPTALSVLGAVSLCCKLLSAMMAFLLALWFKK
jgi:hypothetical protein